MHSMHHKLTVQHSSDLGVSMASMTGLQAFLQLILDPFLSQQLINAEAGTFHCCCCSWRGPHNLQPQVPEQGCLSGAHQEALQQDHIYWQDHQGQAESTCGSRAGKWYRGGPLAWSHLCSVSKTSGSILTVGSALVGDPIIFGRVLIPGIASVVHYGGQFVPPVHSTITTAL
jgi:hypothetical protein